MNGIMKMATSKLMAKLQCHLTLTISKLNNLHLKEWRMKELIQMMVPSILR